MKKGPKVKCLNCGDIIQSKHRHDFVACSCFQETHEIIKGMKELLSPYLDTKLPPGKEHLLWCRVSDTIGTGLAVDGGGDYFRMIGSQAYEVIEDA